MLQKISLETLVKFDSGRIAAAFDAEIASIVKDIKDRPGTAAMRNVSLTATFKPEVNDAGDLVNVGVQFLIDRKTPKRSTNKLSARAIRGGLGINDLAQDDANQGTFDELGPQGVASNG